MACRRIFFKRKGVHKALQVERNQNSAAILIDRVTALGDLNQYRDRSMTVPEAPRPLPPVQTRCTKPMASAERLWCKSAAGLEWRALSSMRNRPSKNDLFKGRHFEQEIIVLCVRWYLRYKLSYRDLVEMMSERGLSVAHTTILRWVRHYTPEFDKRWGHFSAQAGTSWRVDETYIRIRGQWAYLYRAVDAAGKTVDFRLSPRRNVASAKAFLRKAVRSQGRSPLSITLDGYAASHRAVRELQQQGILAELTILRSSKYLNNLIEQDHRNVKSRLGAMLGLKSFVSAVITIRGVELMHRIRKGQFDLHALGTQGQTPSELWAAVLAA